MVFCIGLTGTIGSGKSSVLNCFSQLGSEIINADDVSKKLTMQGSPALKKIIHHFGPSIMHASGDLNRRALRDRIFKDPNERLWLEKWLHPLIRKEIKRRIQQIKSPYCVIEIPLLTDKSRYPYLQRVLLIQTTLELQIARCMARDHHSKDEILAILATQADNQTLSSLADDTIINTGPLEALQTEVEKLHTKYLSFGTCLK